VVDLFHARRRFGRGSLSVAFLGLSLLASSGCSSVESKASTQRAPAGHPSGNPTEAPKTSSATPASGEAGSTKPPVAKPSSPPVEASPRWGYADLDPTNDREVAPPLAVPDCAKKLEALGTEFTVSELPLRQKVGKIQTCGANDAVVVKRLPGGLSVRPPALVTCQMALSLSHFAPRLGELAKKELGLELASLRHMGTYNCRKMVRFDLVSEHSYGNAIDVEGFVLKNGKKLTVKEDFGKLDEAPKTPEARFLRAVGNVAFDEDFFSVSLGPYWDKLHRDHFHFDAARYRVDGSR
jgi:hypothetical protein